ncbi:MAG TPA: flagellar basal-body rod protein FlgG [Bacillota bacterium]|jgi:flagellar basal-body rod protein FlgG|nr:flagellar basal-body rod protein FlgG [Bacillota bacterium]HOL08849.1 flagellar basal-body rod protein FlgG [Bacillota bacterium]HPO96542.1 flagellar basal-body rod protein FlgG [Bacillota bacterium]
MIRALWTAGTGMMAQQLNIDTTANNLANANTVGYKKMRLEFQDLLYQTVRSAGSASAQGQVLPTGLQVGYGVRPVASTKIFTQGDFLASDNPLDIAIEGEGFLQMQLSDGTIAYTRNGSLKLSVDGRIVSSEGYVLQPEITIPTGTTSINIGSDGTVSVLVSGETDVQQIGQLELATFINPAGLENIGKGLYRQTAASGAPTISTPGTDGAGTIIQNYLEMSNVKVVDEMINIIVAQRAYEISSKSIQAADEMLQTANNLRR